MATIGFVFLVIAFATAIAAVAILIIFGGSLLMKANKVEDVAM